MLPGWLYSMSFHSWSVIPRCNTRLYIVVRSNCMLHPSCYSLTTQTSSDMEIKNFISGMNPGMRNLKRIHQCDALNKPSLIKGKWYRSVSAINSHNIILWYLQPFLALKPI
jgi:hypothetical protein